MKLINGMEVIQSFTIDHNNLEPGIYISREDQNFTTFDLRITKPNREPAMTPAAMHTLEHLMATWFRNNVDIKGDVVYVGPMGCHGKGTKILMYDGSVKNVEDIVIGDLLIGEYSEPVKVLNLIQGYDTLYEINQNHGDTFTATGKHLLHLTYSKSEKCFGATKGDTIDITVEDFIKTSNKFKRLFKGYKRGYDGIHQDLPIDPYILGLWLGDGHHKRPILCVADSEQQIADAWIQYGKTIGLDCHIEKEKGNCKSYRLSHKKSPNENVFVEALKSIGVFGHKHIPQIYLISDWTQRLKLLAGLINTDGWCPIRRGVKQERLIFGNTNIELLENVKQLANSLGFNADYKQVRGYHKSIMPNGNESICKPYYYLSISGDVTVLNDWLIPNKQPNKRKSNKNHLLSKIDIKEIGQHNFYGFETDGNHLYHLTDCTICHNCLTGMYVIMSGTPGKYSIEEMRTLVIECLEWILQQTVIPGNNPATCGNYLMHDLLMCKYYCTRYLKNLKEDFHCEYTKLESASGCGMVFADA